MNTIPLNEINTNEDVTVMNIINSPISKKLTEMGIYKGKTISIQFKAPLGDPIAVEIDGCLLSLRISEAKLIQVHRKQL